MGTPTLGKLIALISILPVAFLLPFAIIYWLQYLGRVVVSSGMGETDSPAHARSKLRRLLQRPEPVVHLAVPGRGRRPASRRDLSNCSSTLRQPAGILLTARLRLPRCLPYILMALLMTFLHDDALAAKPLGVLTALVQLGGSFLFLCVFVAFARRCARPACSCWRSCCETAFLQDLSACSAFRAGRSFVWITIVVMRLLGNHYHPHRQVLGWNRDRPRWGVAWKI